MTTLKRPIAEYPPISIVRLRSAASNRVKRFWTPHLPNRHRANSSAPEGTPLRAPLVAAMTRSHYYLTSCVWTNRNSHRPISLDSALATASRSTPSSTLCLSQSFHRRLSSLNNSSRSTTSTRLYCSKSPETLLSRRSCKLDARERSEQE